VTYLGTYGREGPAASLSFSVRESWNDGLAVTELASDGVFLNPPPPLVVQLLIDGDEARVEPLSLRARLCGGVSLAFSLSVLAIDLDGVGGDRSEEGAWGLVLLAAGEKQCVVMRAECMDFEDKDGGLEV
jgi:hypothetical protein